MRKQDLTLGTMWARMIGKSVIPIILASLSDEFHISRGEVGRGNTMGRALRTSRYPGKNGYPTLYLGVVRDRSAADRGEAEYFAIAAKVGAWLETLTSHHYTPVPTDLLPNGFRLIEVRTRDLAGEWATVQREREATEATAKAARDKRDAEWTRQRAALEELRATAELLGMDRTKIEPYADYHGRADYARAVLPVADLLALLTSLKSEG